MTISKKQLEETRKESYEWGFSNGKIAGKKQAEEDIQTIRKSGIIELMNAASVLANSNAKLTYAMSRIADKLL